jgi:hypothetical protein
MNLIEMRARVREDLQDTDPANYRWTDEEVDGAIGRAVSEYSLASPIERQDDIPTTPGEKEVNISSLSGLLKIESVEFPVGRSPRYMQRTECWAGRLYIEDEGDGENARVRWLTEHTVDDQSTSIPIEHEDIIVLGATGYLAMSASAATVDRAFIAGRFGTQSYRAWAKDRLDRYDRKLKAVSRANRIVPNEFYVE